MSVSLESTVAFLQRADAYPEVPRQVDTIQTHMSCVFLTGTYAYKLKKPIQFDSVDFRTADARRRNCEEEVRLNRRLADAVYLGVVALTLEPGGRLGLAGTGEPIDWLVKMRQLPAEHMLDAVVAGGRAGAEESRIRDAALHLARFYAAAKPEPVDAGAHRRLLADGVRSDARQLRSERYRLPARTVNDLARAELDFLDANAPLFDGRIQQGRHVEGHGDLRPEHICLRPAPAIIDCLEFSKDLRVLDPADELAFLALECERLGDGRAGTWCQDVYSQVTGDHPPASLVRFYRVYRALRRARIAAVHLDDPGVAHPGAFIEKAKRYLELVTPPADR